MKKLNKLFYGLLVTFLSIHLYKAPPTTPPPPGGGVGGTTTEAPGAPIDMYWFVLATVAVVFIVMFAKRKKIAA